MYSVKQVIVLRTQYPDGKGGTRGLRMGKLAAQVAHASMAVFLDRGEVRTVFDKFDVEEGGIESDLLEIVVTPEMSEWIRTGHAKIVVGVETEEELLRVYADAQKAGLPTALIQDHGYTEFAGIPTYTACAIGPATNEKIDAITGPNGTVKVKLL